MVIFSYSVAITTPLARTSSPTIAVALGGGGARGIAHITLLEAFDELGLPVVAIAGTSMGAIIGAAYAAGLSGRELREHALWLFRNRGGVMSRLMKARVGRFAHLLTGRGSNPVLLDAERLLDLFWPEAVPDRFEELEIPFMAIATDYIGRREAVFREGLLAPAVAGSMAIPGLIKPIQAAGMVLVDGGAINPLPYNHLIGMADCIVACDVTGGPVTELKGPPAPFSAMLGSAQIMQGALTAAQLQLRAPDILVRPPVERYRALDFFRAAQILAVAESAKDDIKRGLEKHFEGA